MHIPESGYVCNLTNKENRRVDYFELMQFTGLLDKNGKEIYEGDWIKTADDGELVVEFRKEIFGVEVLREESLGENGWETFEHFLSLNDEEINRRYTETEDLYVLEVIGNIFENPE
jgi:uncharacterized phage protein (TIGR01671 family)